MIQSPAFEWIAKKIEAATGWTQLTARGTVRLALKEMGLDPRTVKKEEMTAALRKSLVTTLEQHKVVNARALCARLEMELLSTVLPASSDSPEDIFKRLGRT